jgi:hypothetical protein
VIHTLRRELWPIPEDEEGRCEVRRCLGVATRIYVHVTRAHRLARARTYRQYLCAACAAVQTRLGAREITETT